MTLAQTQLPSGPQGVKFLQVPPGLQGVYEQTPPEHVLPEGHVTPQAPQLVFEVSKSWQPELHSVWLAGQADTVVVVTIVVLEVVLKLSVRDVAQE